MTYHPPLLLVCTRIGISNYSTKLRLHFSIIVRIWVLNNDIQIALYQGKAYTFIRFKTQSKKFNVDNFFEKKANRVIKWVYSSNIWIYIKYVLSSNIWLCISKTAFQYVGFARKITILIFGIWVIFRISPLLITVTPPQRYFSCFFFILLLLSQLTTVLIFVGNE